MRTGADVHVDVRPRIAAAGIELAGRLATRPRPLVVAVAGETGAGKTTLAAVLAEAVAREGERVAVLHQDDYFHFPPLENHARRIADLSHVGPQEVDLDRLERDVRTAAETADVVIVEGTYVLRLERPDVRVFIDRPWTETHPGRVARGRDPIDPVWTPRILAIEQNFIRQDLVRADVVLDGSFTLRTV